MSTPLRVCCLLIAVTLTGCGPVSINHPLNKLTDPISMNVHNGNPQAESFVGDVPIQSDAVQILSAPSSRPSLPEMTPTGPMIHDTDGYFVGLAISGGGSRSANFAAACMFQLQRVGMMQKVDCISAVSGGSLAAALYCVSRDDQWNPHTVQEKLTHPFASDLIGQFLLPWNLLAVACGNLTRSNLLADDFTRVLFSQDGRTLKFADLRRDRPRLLINSTDLETGRRFTFCNSNFDQINSDLNAFPIGYAVCASSAIPVVIDPVTLQDYSTTFPHFYHLVDGGIYDNLGVRILVDSYESQIARNPNPYPYGAIIIVIDAGTEFDGHLSSQATIGWFDSIKEGLGLSSTVLINRASSSTLSDLVAMHSSSLYTAGQLREKISQLWRNHFVELKDSQQHPVRVVHLSLSQIGELSDPSFAATLNSIPTYFNIDSDSAYTLYQAADILFFQRFDAHLMPLVTEINSRKGAATQPSGMDH